MFFTAPYNDVYFFNLANSLVREELRCCNCDGLSYRSTYRSNVLSQYCPKFLESAIIQNQYKFVFDTLLKYYRGIDSRFSNVPVSQLFDNFCVPELDKKLLNCNIIFKVQPKIARKCHNSLQNQYKFAFDTLLEYCRGIDSRFPIAVSRLFINFLRAKN